MEGKAEIAKMNNDKRFGVMITKGPMNWQVFQQTEGKADITLEGSWYHPEEYKDAVRVYVRLYTEKDNLPVINSQPAQVSGSSWTCTLRQVPAGGPYRIETLLQEGDQVIPFEWSCHGDMRHHICVGDVFLIAGQSNAVGYGKDAIEDLPEIGIHMLRENGVWDLATHPLHDTTDTIFPAHQDGANTGHSPYLSFARKLKRKHQWPIGLIMAAKGGSPLDRFDPQGGGDLYRNMLDMVSYQGGGLRAVIWCQGAADANAQDADSYGERLSRTIQSSREDFNIPDLPWFLIQVGRFGDAVPEDDPLWGGIREHQRQLAHRLPQVYTISTIDGVPSDAVHNNAFSNVMIGERIADTVLNQLYGQAHFLCPDIQSAHLEEDRKSVILTFSNVIETVFHCHDQDMPYSILGPQGEDYRITACNSSGCQVTLCTEQPIERHSTVSCVWQANPSFKPPFDSGTRLPVLSFYKVEIEEQAD